MRRWIASLIATLLGGAVGAASTLAEPAGELLREVGTVNFARPNSEVIARDGRLYFSRYAANGNDLAIIALDPDTGVEETLQAGAPDSYFIAADSRYVLYTARGGVRRRLHLQDRRTGSDAQSIALADGVLWARVGGDRVLALQTHEALVFSIPGMQLLGRIPLANEIPSYLGHGAPVAAWGDKIVVTGPHDLVVLDADAREIASYPVPAPGSRYQEACPVIRLLVSGDRAILQSSCDIIRAVDLKTGAQQYEIALRGTRRMAVLGGLIVAVEVAGLPTHRIDFLDLETGANLGQVPGAADLIGAGSRRLMLVEYPARNDPRAPMRATLLEPDEGGIRDSTARNARVLSACSAQADGGGRRLYRVIASCDAAGVQAVIERLGTEPMDDALLAAIERHAVRLAQTFSRFEESRGILEKMGRLDRHPGLVRVLDRKADLFGGTRVQSGDGPFPRGVRRSGLSRDTVPGTYVSGGYLFVSSRVCDSGQAQGGPSGLLLKVYDRKSMVRTGVVAVASCDSNGGPIWSVRAVDGYALVGFVTRPSLPGPNVAVVRLKDVALVGTVRMDGGAGDLVRFRQGWVDCKSRQALDLATASLRPAGDISDACAYGGNDGDDGGEQAQTDDTIYTRHFQLWPVAGNDEFAVSRQDPSGELFRIKKPNLLRFWTVPGDDDLVAAWAIDHATLLMATDLTTRSAETVLDLPEDGYLGASMVRWRNLLFIARGRDLMTFDLAAGVVVGYEPNIVRGRDSPQCWHCEDGYAIAWLHLDDDRLFFLTRDPAADVSIDLPEYSNSLSRTDVFGIE
jgi:hypothetical protein